MILTFVRLIERIARFESWQPLIKFATDREADGNPDQLARPYLYGLLLDVGAATAAAGTSLASVELSWPLLRVAQASLPLGPLALLATLFNIPGMTTPAYSTLLHVRTTPYIHSHP